MYQTKGPRTGTSQSKRESQHTLTIWLEVWMTHGVKNEK